MKSSRIVDGQIPPMDGNDMVASPVLDVETLFSYQIHQFLMCHCLRESVNEM